MKRFLVIFIGLTPLAAFQAKSPAKQPVKPALNHQKAEGCGVNIYGNNNTLGNLTCTGIDGNLAKQLAAITNGTRSDAKLLKEVSAKLDSIQRDLDKQSVNIENSPGSVFSVNQSGGITAGQINVDTHIAPSLTSDQIRDLSIRLKPFVGSKVKVILSSPKNDVRNFASQIVEAMQIALIDAQILVGGRIGGDYPAVSCSVGTNKINLVQALADFLSPNHLIPGKLQAQVEGDPDHVICYIAPW